MPPKKYHSITSIVSSLYCEQKVIHDRELGKATTIETKARALVGQAEHYKFQIEAEGRQAVDKRCYIASAVYGGDSPEVCFLRGWRDRVLLQNRVGRMLISAYYKCSPFLVEHFGRYAPITVITRLTLNCILRLMGWRP